MENKKEFQPTFLDILHEQMKVKHLSVHGLEKGTGIPKNYIEMFISGDFSKLPAAPYVRGYLKQIALIIGVDAGEFWQLYQKQATLKTSGVLDRLPGNRFTLPDRKPKRLIIIFVIVLLVVAYLSINSSALTGRPFLEIDGLKTETTIVTAPEIMIRGRISPNDTLFINGEIVEINNQGFFEKSYPLETGLNNIVFQVNRFLGQDIKIVRRIIYKSKINDKFDSLTPAVSS